MEGTILAIIKNICEKGTKWWNKEIKRLAEERKQFVQNVLKKSLDDSEGCKKKKNLVIEAVKKATGKHEEILKIFREDVIGIHKINKQF